MTSQELFEAVMGFKVDSIEYDDQWVDASQAPEIVWSEDGEQIAGICIHYLAHKCKEWALKQGHYLVSWIEGYNKAISEINFVESPDYKMFKAFTETEAIFKACQWILENKEK